MHVFLRSVAMKDFKFTCAICGGVFRGEASRARDRHRREAHGATRKQAIAHRLGQSASEGGENGEVAHVQVRRPRREEPIAAGLRQCMAGLLLALVPSRGETDLSLVEVGSRETWGYTLGASASDEEETTSSTGMGTIVFITTVVVLLGRLWMRCFRKQRTKNMATQTDEDVTGAHYDELTVEALKDRLRACELSAAGTKAVIVERCRSRHL